MTKRFNNNNEKPAPTAGFFYTNYWKYIKLLALFALPIYFILLPNDHFVGKQSLCLSMLLFDQSCYACGMTKACKAITSFDFDRAYYYNPLSFLVFPILLFYWFNQIKYILKK